MKTFEVKETIYNSASTNTGERYWPFVLFRKGQTLAIVENHDGYEVEKDHILVTDGKKTETIHKKFSE